MKELRQILSEIEKAPVTASYKELEAITKKVGVSLPTAGMDSLKDKCIQSIHTAIQTEMMIKACIYAKRSCFWAAMATIISLIAAIAAYVSMFVMLRSN